MPPSKIPQNENFENVLNYEEKLTKKEEKTKETNNKKNVLKECKEKKIGHSRTAFSSFSALQKKNTKIETVNYSSFEPLTEKESFCKVEMKEVLGCGANASVRLCAYQNQTYAVKIYEKYKLI